ncbi:galactose mutarotase [Cyanobium sp. WAJ14-Wanaka]|uniref:aldose epimerase family protein n=1 Tax=Cyanobium sp. WAJ14-Wanaka TaxID=2823725 RepID=UPI0020CEA079|nr:galactose mutarotase [Cyanobium sp. WAJ14-Wanaka]MCP9774034.1 galactose mutarotase [Cyanobium sp. WAJ14-Wanaka]
MPLIQRDTPYPHWEFSDPSSGDLLRVVPERGGLISGWRCGDREVVYLDLERFLDPAQSVRGGFPVLFPITGGLPNNELPLPQGTFTIGQHGFARQLPWQMEPLADGRGVQLQLSDTPETLAAYPFAFLLSMEVRLAAGALEINTTVTNRSEAPMPFSFGLHPYFNLLSLEGVSFEGLPDGCLNHLTMAPASTAEQMQRLATGIDLLVRPTGPVRLVDGAAGTTLELQPSHPFDLVVLWTEPPRPMVCIEPWSGPRQSLLSGDRKIELAPGASTELNTRYALGQA